MSKVSVRDKRRELSNMIVNRLSGDFRHTQTFQRSIVRSVAQMRRLYTISPQLFFRQKYKNPRREGRLESYPLSPAATAARCSLALLILRAALRTCRSDIPLAHAQVAPSPR